MKTYLITLPPSDFPFSSPKLRLVTLVSTKFVIGRCIHQVLHLVQSKKLLGKFFCQTSIRDCPQIDENNNSKSRYVIQAKKFFAIKASPYQNKVQNILCLPGWLSRGQTLERCFLHRLKDSQGWLRQHVMNANQLINSTVVRFFRWESANWNVRSSFGNLSN